MKITVRTLLVSSILIAAAIPALAAEEVKPAAATPAAAVAPVQAAVKAEVPSTKEHAVKIGYVEMPKLAQESAPGKAAQKLIKEKADKLRGQIAAKEKQLEKQKESLQAKMESFSQQQRAAKGKEFQKKVEEFQKFVQKSEKEIQSKQEELLNKLFSSVEKAATEYGKANGYSAIVPKKELLYLGSGVEVTDVTDEVMKLVQ